MARVRLARQQISDAGLVPVYSPANPDGHQVENSGGRIILHVRNAGENEVTITVRSGYAVGGLKLQDRQVSVPAGGSVFVGPFDSQVYNQPGTSQVHFDVSDPIDVDVVVLLVQ